ncbi:tetratricopeptide repeat protein [Paraflavitalea sp. CAU 1676]|uniref:tetratricopeptide repeat protein n=1 Tax=Paraflavitalea sp. CAU 1676 TaxID=3032598 RepID=UPI0023DC6D15|nr:tetratricopeptide repeat protein [Paraflavitalea sp. CAU 1676]MDF2193595.1 tetratricopeptide repeat protein [Paraflavitalea sp. CAU 1676]
MKKQQMVLIGSGVVLLCLVYFFGRTIPPKDKTMPAATANAAGQLDIETILAASRQKLTPSQQAHVSKLESAVVRGDVKEQQIKVFRQLAEFWKDSAHMLLPFAWYSGEAAKLENSQKNLTFAAQFYLDGIRRQDEPALKRWMAIEAKELFEKALQLDPNDDSLKIGLGSCYLLGGISDNPMQGIQMIREVSERDPHNMYAQFMLGIGGLVSGQLDKAIERLTKVAEHEPNNLEAILMLADACERKGDKANAIKWYTASRKLLKEPGFVKDIDDRIESLKK